MKIKLIRATFDLIIHGGENRLDSHSGENIHNGDTRTKIDSILTHHFHSEFGNGTGHAHAQ